MLQIDPEFEEKIPPLTDEEFKQLEDNILAEGRVIMPLVVWNGRIVDGHNRYRIIQEHPEVEYTVYEKDFPERYSAIAWICKNQLGRRNLTPQQRKYLIGQRYEAEKMALGASDGFRGNQYDNLVNPQNGDLPKNERKNTSMRIAEETNTSKNYVQRAGEFARGVDAAEEVVPGAKEKILSGEIKPTAADVAAVARTPPEEREEKVKQFFYEREKLLPEIDYPWKEEDESEADDAADDCSKADIRRIGEEMATRQREMTLDDIFLELEDAAESMLGRWEICRKTHPALFAKKECRTSIHKLVKEVTTYLKNFEGGNIK